MNCQVDDINIYYETAGKGVPVLFLHGWGGGIDGFKGTFNVLKNKFRVINLALPGFGGSGRPLFPYSVKDYAEVVKKFLQALNIEKVNIAAHSFGGRIAITLAAEGGLVEKLALIDSAGIKPRRGLLYYFKVTRYKRKKKRAQKKGLPPPDGGSADYRAASGVMREILVKAVNEDLSPLLPKISAPTALVWGGRDRATPLYMAKKLRRGIRGSTLNIIEGAGHYSYIDAFERVNGMLTEFFK